MGSCWGRQRCIFPAERNHVRIVAVEKYWAPYSKTHPREHNSNRAAYHQWCALPTKRALVTHSPYILSKYMFLNLPCVSSVVQLVSDFVFTPYVLRQRHGIKVTPPPVTCVILMMSNMSSMFHCANPHVISLRRKYAPLFPPTAAHDVSTFLAMPEQ